MAIRLPISLLGKFLNFESKFDYLTISEKLTQLGFEVEEVEKYEDKYRNFIIGEVTSCSKHPSADRLNVCSVDIGDGSPRQIVCGAKNVRQGIRVCVATESAIIPESGMVITKSNIRGIDSNGMICSESELGMYLDGTDGIMELDDSFAIGDSFSSAMFDDDVVLTLNITPNRGDCTCVYGFARELSAAGFGNLVVFDYGSQSYPIVDDVEIDFSSSDCEGIGFSKIEGLVNHAGINNIKKDLIKFNIKPNTAIVDISNFIMMMIGTPMHIYDSKKIEGKVSIRNANDFDLKLLNGESKKIESSIVVEDEKKIISILGVMGSDSSKVDQETTDILIECAYVDPIKFRLANKHNRINSESKFRFERGIDKSMISFAVNYASRLIVDSCGGSIKGVKVSFKNQFSKNLVRYRPSSLTKLTGMLSEDLLVEKILISLGFGIINEGSGYFNISVPYHRHDISCEADIVEEIARVIGYENIGVSQPICLGQTRSDIDDQYLLGLKIKKILSSIGYNEVINMPFTKSSDQALFSEKCDNLMILNPISSEYNYITSFPLINMLVNLNANLEKRKISNYSLFEFGTQFGYSEEEKSIKHDAIICGLRSGHMVRDDHRNEGRLVDIFDTKSDLFKIISDIYGYSEHMIDIQRSDSSFSNNYKSFDVLLDDQKIGQFGEIHPRVLSYFDIKVPVVFFYLLPNAIVRNKKIEQGNLVNGLQPIEKDMSFIISNQIDIGKVLRCIYEIDSSISNVILKDIYSGDFGDGLISIMLSIEINPDGSQDFATRIMSMISEKINIEYNGKLRGVI